MSDEPPGFVRLSGGRFGRYERDLTLNERFRKELAELDELHDHGPRDKFLKKLDRLIALATAPVVGGRTVAGLTQSDCDVLREVLQRRIARWRLRRPEFGDDDG
jgi:hypothetical protein